MKGKISQLLIHIAGCVTFLAFPIVFSPDATSLSDLWNHPPAVKDFIVYVLLILFFYFNFFWLIPRFYFNKRYVGYVLVCLACFGLIVLAPNLLIPGRERGAQPPWERFGEPPERSAGAIRPPAKPPGPENAFPQPPADSPDSFRAARGPQAPGGFQPQQWSRRNSSPSFLIDISHNVFLFLAVVFFSLILKISNRWKQTEREKLNAELSYLKAQINPHFLFNTLNSIYSLAIEKSDNTATAVVKLSGMMRYVLSEAGNDLVPLDKELTYIRHYIELQQIRFGNSIPLSFTVSGQTGDRQIAPLILISFVENAFKHGINAEENSDIRIGITVNEHALRLTVFNNKVTVRHAPEEQSGLGIGNAKERLELLYPGRHVLNIEDNDRHFSVSLILHLK